MTASRLVRPASRLLSASRVSQALLRPAISPSVSSAAPVIRRRQYATPSGSKELTVRDALNDAMAEEMEQNDKVFILGEEVAQYNGA